MALVEWSKQDAAGLADILLVRPVETMDNQDRDSLARGLEHIAQRIRAGEAISPKIHIAGTFSR